MTILELKNTTAKMNIHYTDSTADLRWQMKQSVYSTREQEKLSILKKKKPEGKNTEKKNEKNLRDV